jgi:hypothetical protein
MHSPQHTSESTPDVLVNNVGTLYTFCPLTLRAKRLSPQLVVRDTEFNRDFSPIDLFLTSCDRLALQR